MSVLYACPVCEQPLTLNKRRWQCPAMHSFDVHSKGYVNLLPVQRKRSKAPGDNKEMVLRRRQFLEAGYYAPLAMNIAQNFQRHLPQSAQVLDAGCGEGYYTQAIAGLNPGFQCYGLDISKAAVQAATKYKQIEWSVASSSHPPFSDQVFDGIVSIFSRVDSDPFARILKPGGRVCMVTPDKDHLHELRSLIYSEVQPYNTSKHKDYFDSRFSLFDEQSLQFEFSLTDNQAIQDLLGMTPHSQRLSSSATRRLQAQATLEDQACFKVYWFELRNKGPETLS